MERDASNANRQNTTNTRSLWGATRSENLYRLDKSGLVLTIQQLWGR